jgi:hypothetical protein
MFYGVAVDFAAAPYETLPANSSFTDGYRHFPRGHRDDISLIESAVRSKLNVAVTGATPEVLAAGLKRAHEVLTPVLTGVRAQVAMALENDAARASQNAGNTSPKPFVKRSRLIN